MLQHNHLLPKLYILGGLMTTACYEDAAFKPSSPLEANQTSGVQGQSREPGPSGPQGPAGPQGPQGIPGAGCTISAVNPNSQYPNGGAQVTCGSNTSAIIQNGASSLPNEWKLVASGSNWTEGAQYTLLPTGVTGIRLMTPFNNQHIGTSVFNWPASNATQVRFIVKNLADGFCVGGNGVLSLGGNDPAPVPASCTQYRYAGDANGNAVLSRDARQDSDWIRLSINGVKKNTCINSLQNTPLNDYSGMFGSNNYHAVECVYSGGGPAGVDWQNAITSFTVEEQDYSGGAAVWSWEIWAR